MCVPLSHRPSTQLNVFLFYSKLVYSQTSVRVGIVHEKTDRGGGRVRQTAATTSSGAQRIALKSSRMWLRLCWLVHELLSLWPRQLVR